MNKTKSFFWKQEKKKMDKSRQSLMSIEFNLGYLNSSASSMENFDSIIDHNDKTCFSETDMQNFKIIKSNVQNNKGIKDF